MRVEVSMSCSRNKKGQFRKGINQGHGFKNKQIPWNKGISCSEETKNKIRKANKGKRNSPTTEFKRAPIGTKHLAANGYINVKVAHPNKWRREHIVIAEKIYKKKVIKNKTVVHHIDCNDKNNNPENLYICSVSKHKKLHSFESMINQLMKKNLIKFNRKKGIYEIRIS